MLDVSGVPLKGRTSSAPGFHRFHPKNLPPIAVFLEGYLQLLVLLLLIDLGAEGGGGQCVVPIPEDFDFDVEKLDMQFRHAKTHLLNMFHQLVSARDPRGGLILEIDLERDLRAEKGLGFADRPLFGDGIFVWLETVELREFKEFPPEL